MSLSPIRLAVNAVESQKIERPILADGELNGAYLLSRFNNKIKHRCKHMDVMSLEKNAFVDPFGLYPKAFSCLSEPYEKDDILPLPDHGIYTGAIRQKAYDAMMKAAPDYKKWAVYDNGRLIKTAFFQDVNFRAGELAGADFNHARLKKVNFAGTRLSEANFSLTNITDTDFSGANLFKANLWSSTCERADFSGADLRQANLSSLTRGRAQFNDSSFYKAKLTAAKLSCSDLRYALFFANDFVGAEGSADMRQVNLSNSIVLANSLPESASLDNINGLIYYYNDENIEDPLNTHFPEDFAKERLEEETNGFKTYNLATAEDASVPLLRNHVSPGLFKLFSEHPKLFSKFDLTSVKDIFANLQPVYLDSKMLSFFLKNIEHFKNLDISKAKFAADLGWQEVELLNKCLRKTHDAELAIARRAYFLK